MVKTKQNPAGEQDERRRYVRVQDAIGLQIQRLADMPAAGQEESPATRQLTRSKVRRHDKYDIEGYGTVRKEHPAVAQYIDELEERIRELLLDGDIPSGKPSHKVSLSAGGLFFSDKSMLQPGEMLGLSLTLFPSGRRIGTDARIIPGNDAPEIAKGDELVYRVEFVRMSDADREAIDQHVRKLLAKSSRRTADLD